MKILLSLSLFFCLYGCRAQPGPLLPSNKDNNTLLWGISGNGLSKPSYLFGTFHLMCKEDIHFSNNLKQALEAAQEVYFEMDMDDPANTLGALLFMNMKEGKKITDLMDSTTYFRLEKFFKDSLRTSLKSFQKMKPSMLEAFLYPKFMPCKSLSGIDQELVKMATRSQKEIKGFETIALQAAVFDSIPYDVQAKSLLKTIDSIGQYRQYFDSMLHIYKMQQMDKLESFFSKSEFGLQEGMEFLLDNRNRNWVNQLKSILPKNNVFIAVGAGHLPGKMGLIELLRKEGYTLTPILN